ncbi:hypothetical protein G7Y89_g587 [Cudoniella acicularis]|uniref:Uncharacterized protein n=1 Tax=Cudoniella acicularis TaxID=354080 RepID=A0A8H4RXX4_9HELO|nr:hypothetical protein G7Y89_g587 [Cudoniella acicularis]
MFSTLVRRTAQQKIPQPHDVPFIYTNPYKAKRQWPPDFSKISQKHQFRLERRYRRRSKLKWARPRWTKAVKLAQLGSIVFVTFYGVLFLDWNTQGNPDNPPFQGIRNWFFGITGSIWSRDHARRRTSPPDDASPVAGTSS